MYFTSKKGSEGFSLIEALVAVAILVAVTAAVIQVSIKGMMVAAVSRERLVLSYLAQEPIEVIRSIRDSNLLQGLPFDQGLLPCMPGPCRVNTSVVPPTIVSCGATCPNLRLNAVTGLYGYTGTLTRFRRSVSITPVPGTSDEMHITVTMRAQGQTAVRTFVVESNLFNW